MDALPVAKGCGGGGPAGWCSGLFADAGPLQWLIPDADAAPDKGVPDEGAASGGNGGGGRARAGGGDGGAAAAVPAEATEAPPSEAPPDATPSKAPLSEASAPGENGLALAYDLGGTNVRAAVVDLATGAVVGDVAVAALAEDRSLQGVAAAMARVGCQALSWAAPGSAVASSAVAGGAGPWVGVRCVAVAQPGIVAPAPGGGDGAVHGVVAEAVAFPDWPAHAALGNAVASALASALAAKGAGGKDGMPPVLVFEDAGAHLLGELYFGGLPEVLARNRGGGGGEKSSESENDGPMRGTAVLVCVGTGVGTACVVDGQLLAGVEGGHIVVVPSALEAAPAGLEGALLSALPCGCGQTGCAEAHASGPAILKAALGNITRLAGLYPAGAAAEAMAALGDCAAVLAAAEKHVGSVPGSAAEKHVGSVPGSAAALAGQASHAAVEAAAECLARACLALARALGPHAFLLTGGVLTNAPHGKATTGGEALSWFGARVKAHYRRLDWAVASVAPEFMGSALGGVGGVLGAAALARGALANGLVNSPSCEM